MSDQDTKIDGHDLLLMLKIIDTSAEEGVFTGSNLSKVGALRDKIYKVLEPHLEVENNGEKSA